MSNTTNLLSKYFSLYEQNKEEKEQRKPVVYSDTFEQYKSKEAADNWFKNNNIPIKKG